MDFITFSVMSRTISPVRLESAELQAAALDLGTFATSIACNIYNRFSGLGSGVLQSQYLPLLS